MARCVSTRGFLLWYIPAHPMTNRHTTASILVCCLLAAGAAAPAANSPSSRLVAEVGDAYLDHLKARDVSLRVKFGLPIERLPDISLGAEEKDAAVARSLLDRLAPVKPAELRHEETLSLDILRRQLRAQIDGPRFYWLNFPVTPYASPFGAVNQAYKALPLKDAASVDATWRCSAAAGVRRCIRSKVEGQAARGIRDLEGRARVVVPFIQSLGGDAATSPYMAGPGTPREPARRPRREPAHANDGGDRGRAQAEAPSPCRLPRRRLPGEGSRGVGLGQYPGGAEYYAWLVRWHTTLDVTPKQVHDIGLERVAAIEAEMAKVREEHRVQGNGRPNSSGACARTRASSPEPPMRSASG